MKRFENKVAFITGGNSGIGKASAILIASEGAKVVIADIKENLETLEEIRKEGAEVQFIQCDVSKAEDMERAVKETVDRYGSLDVAFNNAGITDKGMSPIHEKSIEEWQSVQNINLNGVFFGLKYQVAQMRLQENGGSIVNMGSLDSVTATGNIASYTSAKHAVIGLTKSAALENATQKIRVNALGPGYIATPMLLSGGLDEQTLTYMKSLHPMNRLGKPEEIAKAFLFLASEDASFITGVYLPVDGGYLIK
ncbi:SDR family NAD(P)-dependent oxidoreductase [Sphingobacterium sp. LRF_L2]|uniref:SDR family NAD(P)-dependent oxidoreductase n=1 Tax=Sphingobacterium sp. LRF_L2 TaxID=3369421 RepID=UPI003F6305E1